MKKKNSKVFVGAPMLKDVENNESCPDQIEPEPFETLDGVPFTDLSDLVSHDITRGFGSQEGLSGKSDTASEVDIETKSEAAISVKSSGSGTIKKKLKEKSDSISKQKPSTIELCFEEY